MRLPKSHQSRLAAAEIETGEGFVAAESLSVRYGARPILDEVSLEIRRGEIMVIMGGSGSGKSTLLRHLIGLETPASGVVRLFGRDIRTLGIAEMQDIRKHIGVAFQGGALFSSMSVAENIKFPLREHARLDEKTMDIMARLKLELVNLSGFGDLMPSELWGGMLKRAAVARAIIMDPSILFFDEPSAGLDPVVSAELDGLIRTLRDAMDITVIVVTHELESAFSIADRITVLDQGRILAVGTVDEIRASDNTRIRSLLDRRPGTAPRDGQEYLRRLTGAA